MKRPVLKEPIWLITFIAMACVTPGFPQDRGQRPQATPQSGIASGAAHAPVMDAQRRPITAGGFVEGAPVVFVDATRDSGLAKFHHRSGGAEKTTIIETPGS